MEANTDGAGSRRMETVALRYSQGKKKEKRKHTLPCVFVVFHLHYGKPTMEISRENMREPSPWEWCRCVGEVFFSF